MLESFGQWLFEARKNAEMTQTELADRVHCSKSYIGTLERDGVSSSGKPVRPSLELVDAFADALNKSRPDARLAAGYAAPAPANEPYMLFAKKIDSILRRVPGKQRQRIEKALEEDAAKYVSLLTA